MKATFINSKKIWIMLCILLLVAVCLTIDTVIAKYIVTFEVGNLNLTIESLEGAYAVYTDDGTNDSLEFFYGKVPPVGGTSPSGKAVTAVYIGIEESNYTRGWSSYAGQIKSVKFYEGTTEAGEQRKIQPKTMKSWFEEFRNVSSFDFSGLDTSNVTNMSRTFYYCNNLVTLDITSFNTSNVTTMDHMFFACKKVKEFDVSNFDTSKVKNMQYMFSICYAVETLDLSNFNTTNVNNMTSMFSADPGYSKLKRVDLSSFNTTAVTNMQNMFYHCEQLITLDLRSFNTTMLKSTEGMFNHCYELSSIFVDSIGWDMSNVTSSLNMFARCDSLVGSNGTEYNSNYTDKTYAIIDGTGGAPGYLSGDIIQNEQFFAVYGDVYAANGNSLGKGLYFYETLASLSAGAQISLNDGTYQIIEESYSDFTAAPWSTYASTIKVVNIVEEINPVSTAYWFNGFKNCTSFVGLSNLKTAGVTSMANMFRNCTSLTDSDLSTFTIDTASAKSLNGMFYGCTGLTNSNGTTFNFTNSAVAADSNAQILLTDLRNMFRICEGLKKINLNNLYISQNTVLFAYMFYQCTEITEITFSDRPIYSFASVAAGGSPIQSGTAYMFAKCGKLEEIDISFIKCKTNSAQEMFTSCSALTKIYVDILFGCDYSVDSYVSMFAQCNSLVGGNGMTLAEALKYEPATGNTAPHANSKHARIDGHNGFAGYFTAKEHNQVIHSSVTVGTDDTITWDNSETNNYGFKLAGQHAFYANPDSIVKNVLKLTPGAGQTDLPNAVTVIIDNVDMTGSVTYNKVEGTLTIPAKLLNSDSVIYIAAASTFDGLEEEENSTISFDFMGIGENIDWHMADVEMQYPVPNKDYGIVLLPAEGYKLSDTVKVDIDGTVYNVSTTVPSAEGEPTFIYGILIIPAELLTEETKSLAITVSAIPAAEQTEEEKPAEVTDTDKPTEEIKQTFDIDITEIENADIKGKDGKALSAENLLDGDGNAILVIKADEGYTLPEIFIISISGTEYEIDTTKAEQEDEIIWDSEIGTLTIPKDLLNGENVEIGVKLQAIIKEDDGEETDDKKAETEADTSEDTSSDNTAAVEDTTSSDGEIVYESDTVIDGVDTSTAETELETEIETESDSTVDTTTVTQDSDDISQDNLE